MTPTVKNLFEVKDGNHIFRVSELPLTKEQRQNENIGLVKRLLSSREAGR